MLKKAACSTNGQLMLPTRNRWYESIFLAGVTFALLRPYYVARVLLGAESKYLFIAIAAVVVYGLIFLLQRLRAKRAKRAKREPVSTASTPKTG